MSDAEAMIELAKSLQHLDKALENCESDELREKCKLGFDQVSSALHTASDSVDDDCSVEGLEINQTISID